MTEVPPRDPHEVLTEALKFGFDGVSIKSFDFDAARAFISNNAPNPAVAVRVFDIWRCIVTAFDEKDDGLHAAWGLIANAYGGDWGRASKEWREAAERWRDRYA